MEKRQPITQQIKLPSVQDRDEGIRARLQECMRDRTYADIARDTGLNSETVRRTMTRSRASAALLMAVCEVYEIDAEWLLCGRIHKQSSTDFSLDADHEQNVNYPDQPEIHVNRIISSPETNGIKSQSNGAPTSPSNGASSDPCP